MYSGEPQIHMCEYRMSYKSIFVCVCVCLCMYTERAKSPYSPAQEWCCAVLAEGSSHIQNISDDICNIWHESVGVGIGVGVQFEPLTATAGTLRSL